MTTNPLRRKDKPGVPHAAGLTGGAFASHDRGEAPDTVALSAPPVEKNWGSVNISEGSRSPWGEVQHVEHFAEGMTFISTAGHGGVKLSPQRNALIPAPLRRRSGWYEEDTEVAIPEAYFPEEFTKVRWGAPRTAEEFRETAFKHVRDWYPDEYEKATGESVLPGQSHVRDDQLFAKTHENDFVFAGSDRSVTDPEHLLIRGRVAATEETAEFLVPRVAFKGLDDYRRFVIDPARHRRLPEKAPQEDAGPKLQTFDLSDVDASALTPAARESLEKDLRQRWRDEAGYVRSLRDIIERDGVSGRTVYVNEGKRSYALLQGSSSLRVSAATWKALTMIPDDRTPSRVAYEDFHMVAASIDRAGGRATREQRARYDKLLARYNELSEQERAQERPIWEAKARRKEADQAARERAATVTPA
ncbi:hypothetical protein [Curtobacterium sp. MCBD17_040]|uniref:DUF7007 domain-containing protein n=1 Tax=Curtobacterium sp. MCBD17_040 TaxID=2175674 RepID=UPI000DA97EDF|nr:hypothetical protein [Curtobacterium sp. MCBD17_040]WIB65345.1 hypothetical protein DEI94_18230 [Curtobacterium sp. MCBD17_040]